MNLYQAFIICLFCGGLVPCAAEESIKCNFLEIDPNLVLRFFEEGNFTNSGQKEILAFYQKKSTAVIEGTPNYTVSITYCLIINKQNDELIKKLKVPFTSDDFTQRMKSFLEKMDLDPLGRETPVGRIGDFNNNGKEEMYFYQIVGSGFYPIFIEYDGTQFNKILDYKTRSPILGVEKADAKNTEIILSGVGGIETEEYRYRWNIGKNAYEQISR